MDARRHVRRCTYCAIAPHHAAIAVAAARKASLDLLERLSVTAELRDDFTGRHCYRVGWLAHRLAERTMMDAATLKAIRIAARLHDIGKLAATGCHPEQAGTSECGGNRNHEDPCADWGATARQVRN